MAAAARRRALLGGVMDRANSPPAHRGRSRKTGSRGIAVLWADACTPSPSHQGRAPRGYKVHLLDDQIDLLGAPADRSNKPRMMSPRASPTSPRPTESSADPWPAAKEQITAQAHKRRAAVAFQRQAAHSWAKSLVAVINPLKAVK